jgi:short-subunit dehydrogenase
MARQFADQGAKLVLIARRIDRLEKLKRELGDRGAEAIVHEGDVRKDGDVAAAVAKSQQVFGRLDIVIANAGYGVAGDFEKLCLDDYHRQFETNIFGVLRTIYESLDALKSTKGQVVIMGSINSYVGLPRRSAYAMSKSSLRALAQSLYVELARYGIAVTLISPGFVKTEIHSIDKFGRFDPDSQVPPTPLHMDTGKAVRQMIPAIRKKKAERIITGHGILTAIVMALVPWLIPWVLKKRRVRKYGCDRADSRKDLGVTGVPPGSKALNGARDPAFSNGPSAARAGCPNVGVSGGDR